MKYFLIRNKLIIYLISLFVLLECQGCLMSTGTHGTIETYNFSYSKKLVNSAIQTLFKNYPMYKVPNEHYDYTWHYGGDSTTKDQWIIEANADSVSFNFYFKDQGCIVWCKFIGHSNGWEASKCQLALIGYVYLGKGKWRFASDLTKEEREKIETEFKSCVISKIQAILAAPHRAST